MQTDISCTEQMTTHKQYIKYKFLAPLIVIIKLHVQKIRSSYYVLSVDCQGSLSELINFYSP